MTECETLCAKSEKCEFQTYPLNWFDIDEILKFNMIENKEELQLFLPSTWLRTIQIYFS